MKVFLVQIVIVLFSSTVVAQFDFSNQSKRIPPPMQDAHKNSSILLDPKASKNDVRPYSSSKKIEEPTSGGMTMEKEQFFDIGKVHEKRLNKREGTGDYKIFRKNEYFGDVHTKSGSIKVLYRDPQYVDGDIIRVSINDVVIKHQVILEATYQGFDFDLFDGFNKIDFEALNEGLSPPNTAEFKIYDDTGKLLSQYQWNIATGFKATIIVVKDTN